MEQNKVILLDLDRLDGKVAMDLDLSADSVHFYYSTA